MQKPDNPQEEILIMEIIFILLKYKFYILILTFLFTFCSYFYLKDANYGYSATLDIRKIPTVDTLEYRQLSFFNVTNFTLSDEDTGNVGQYKDLNFLNNFIIDQDVLFKMFLEKFSNNKEILIDHFFKQKLLDINDFESEEEYIQAIKKLVYNIKIEDSSLLIKSNVSLEKLKNEINLGLQEIQKSIQNDIKKTFKNFIELKITNEEFILNHRFKFVDNMLNDYERETERKLILLNENSAIAKKLNIAVENFEINTYKPIISVLNSSINETANDKYYIRGYETIDEEIRLIKSRGDNYKAFVVGLLEAENRIREIKDDQTVEQLETYFKRTSVYNKNFKAISYDIDSIEVIYERSQLILITFIVSLVLLCLLATVYHRYYDYLNINK